MTTESKDVNSSDKVPVQPSSGSATDEPVPGILRRASTVRFFEPATPTQYYSDKIFYGTIESPIPPIQQRTGTIDTNISKASSRLEERWRKQTVLSFDGGGIRGYSSLLILREIMRVVGKIEREYDPEVDSSFRPKEYVPPHSNGKVPSRKESRRQKKQRKMSSQANSQTASPVSSLADCELKGKPNETNDDEPCRYLPCHYFDYIGGTSTGGLIAIMLGRLRMGVDECLKEYENFGGDIFGHPRWFSLRGPLPSFKQKYNGRRLQKAVEEVVQRRSSPAQKAVGAGYFKSAKELCRTVVVAYQWKDHSLAPRYGNEISDDVAAPDTPHVAPSQPGAYLFRSYDHWGTPGLITERNPGPADNIPIWQVARATTAAPTYFDPVSIQNCTFGDGGLGSNNPVKEIFLEVTTMHGNNPHVIDLLVSLGTGQPDDVELRTSGWSKISSYINAIKALATDSEQKHIEMTGLQRTTLRDMQYSRFNVPNKDGLKNMKLDEWKEVDKWRVTRHGLKRREKGTLDKIKCITLKYCEREDVQRGIRKVAENLVRHRQARCTDKRKWELWATGIRYRCTKDDCDKAQKLRPSRHNLESHLKMVHGYRDDTEKEKAELKKIVDFGICHY